MSKAVVGYSIINSFPKGNIDLLPKVTCTGIEIIDTILKSLTNLFFIGVIIGVIILIPTIIVKIFEFILFLIDRDD